MAAIFPKGSGKAGSKPSSKDTANMTINQMAGLAGKNQRLGKNKDFLSSIASENMASKKIGKTGKTDLYGG